MKYFFKKRTKLILPWREIKKQKKLITLANYVDALIQNMNKLTENLDEFMTVKNLYEFVKKSLSSPN